MKDLLELRSIIDREMESLTYPHSPDTLYSPIRYVIQLKAKRIRPLLVLIAYQLFDDDVERALSPAIAIELFHNFTLIHDDIMDNAPLRRGKPTVHKKWDTNAAILSGDVMMIKAYQLLAKLDLNNFKEVFNVFSKAAVEVCEGQQLDIDFESNSQINITDYIKMIQYKTAVLLAASLKIGAIIAGAGKDEQDNLYNFGINMGIAFQLKDDFLDVFGCPKVFGKQLGGDILANKKTFLYLKAIELADKPTKDWLEMTYSSKKVELKVSEVTEAFHKLNIEKHTMDMIQNYYTRAMSSLDLVVSDKKDLLIAFSDQLIDRVS